LSAAGATAARKNALPNALVTVGLPGAALFAAAGAGPGLELNGSSESSSLAFLAGAAADVFSAGLAASPADGAGGVAPGGVIPGEAGGVDAVGGPPGEFGGPLGLGEALGAPGPLGAAAVGPAGGPELGAAEGGAEPPSLSFDPQPTIPNNKASPNVVAIVPLIRFPP